MSKTKTNSSVVLVIEILAVAGLWLHVIFVLGTWGFLPASIPFDFSFAGAGEALGDQSDLLCLFGLAVLIYLCLTWLGRYPQKFNNPGQITADSAERQCKLARIFLKAIKSEMVWLFAVISMQTVNLFSGLASGLGSFLTASAIAMTGLTAIGYSDSSSFFAASPSSN